MTSDVAERANPAAVEELLEIGREQLLVVVDDVRLTCYFYPRIRIIFKVFLRSPPLPRHSKASQIANFAERHSKQLRVDRSAIVALFSSV